VKCGFFLCNVDDSAVGAAGLKVQGKVGGSAAAHRQRVEAASVFKTNATKCGFAVFDVCGTLGTSGRRWRRRQPAAAPEDDSEKKRFSPHERFHSG